jgi:hypothetical protein
MFRADRPQAVTVDFPPVELDGPPQLTDDVRQSSESELPEVR